MEMKAADHKETLLIRVDNRLAVLELCLLTSNDDATQGFFPETRTPSHSSEYPQSRCSRLQAPCR